MKVLFVDMLRRVDPVNTKAAEATMKSTWSKELRCL